MMLCFILKPVRTVTSSNGALAPFSSSALMTNLIVNMFANRKILFQSSSISLMFYLFSNHHSNLDMMNSQSDVDLVGCGSKLPRFSSTTLFTSRNINHDMMSSQSDVVIKRLSQQACHDLVGSSTV
uniref:Uncharacterized protein n=1 Tax=Cucumis melo TaxID=3656 RepID=A0A9I9E634_CUCME